jgi:galactosamine-6-phosphate isomerase
MQVDVQESYASLSEKAADIILRGIAGKRNLLLCAATGNTPVGTYDVLVKARQGQEDLFADIQIIKLDEWGGLNMNDPATCESFLQSHLLQPLDIDPSRYISFNSNPADPKAECERIRNELSARGPIDICVLGLGMNGHVALNEPADALEPETHPATLSERSMQHSMLAGLKKKPSYGLTLGMADILQSRTILMLISGKEKKEIARSFLSGKISTRLPASFLRLHANVICLISKDAM